MLHGQAIASLRNWEEQFPVLSWNVRGVHVWPLIRTRLASRMLADGRAAVQNDRYILPAKAGSHTRPAGSHTRHPRQILKSSHPQILKSAAALFLSRPSNRQFVDGVWYDRFIDPIADVLDNQGLSSVLLEYRTHGTRYQSPRYRPAIEIRRAVTRRNVAALLTTLAPADLEGYDEFARAVRRDHPTVPILSRWWVARAARSVDHLARYFEGVLRRTDARLAFCSVYYNWPGMALCLAARRRGIAAIDIQHGVTGGNPAYEGWSRFPAGGFALMPRWFWCWSDTDADPVTAWPDIARGCHDTVVGGHPWVALWSTTNPITTALRRQAPARREGSFTVLVTLTWSSGLSEELKRLLIDAPADWTWWIRLHPLMADHRSSVKSWCEEHLPDGAHVDGPTDLPLPLLLERADVHLTHNSSVVQEAARFGLSSVVIDPHALDVYKGELRSGWAVFAGETASIVEKLVAQSHQRKRLEPTSPYPSWDDMSNVVSGLFAEGARCPATAHAVSCQTRAQA